MKHLSALLAVALVALCGQAQAAPAAVKAADAWCRAAPAGALSGACYLTLTAGADDKVTGIASPAAARVEIHDMDMTGGIMRMRKVDSLALPKGQAVALSPGGQHVMLFSPVRGALVKGAQVVLTIRFAKAPALSVTAPVR